MHIKSIASATILAAALGFSGFAYAQTASTDTLPMMIGNVELNEADALRVKVYCEDLLEDENAAVGLEDNKDDTEEMAAVGSVDLEAITLENCFEAGFVERIGD